jgi:hypothetical protein
MGGTQSNEARQELPKEHINALKHLWRSYIVRPGASRADLADLRVVPALTAHPWAGRLAAALDTDGDGTLTEAEFLGTAELFTAPRNSADRRALAFWWACACDDGLTTLLPCSALVNALLDAAHVCAFSRTGCTIAMATNSCRMQSSLTLFVACLRLLL